jgi:hypothetical protein
MQGSKLEDQMPHDDQHQNRLVRSPQLHQFETMPQVPSGPQEDAIFCDAAWKLEQNTASAPAGIGIFIQMEHNEHCKQMYISAMSPPALSPLQAEAYGLELATKIAEFLKLREPRYYTDSSVLASAAAASNIAEAPGHWMIRPHLARIQASSSFNVNRIAHLHRSSNVKAHHQARLATKIQTRSLVIRCLCSRTGQCPARDILALCCVDPFKLLSVKCA